MKTTSYKHIFSAALLAMAGTLMTGCVEETFPTGSFTEDQLGGSNSGAASKGMALGTPATMNVKYFADRRDWAFGYGAILHIRDIYTQDLAAQNDNDYQQFYYFGRNEFQGRDYIFMQYMWNFPMKIIATANLTINSINPETANAEGLGWLGTAHAFRAMCYLDMARSYEFLPSDAYPEAKSPDGKDITGLTVPIVLGTETEEELRNNPRRTREEMFEFIKGDLDKAIEYMDGFTGGDKTVPHQDCAYGLMARLYMWVEDYENAEKYARLAIDASTSQPMTQENGMNTSTGFNDINQWMWGSAISKEALYSNLANWTALCVNETWFGYPGPDGGCDNCIDANVYKRMSDTDWRKLMYKAPAGSALDGKNVFVDDELGAGLHEYASTKFRPGGGNTNDYTIACVTAYPLMRVEEMYFIEAEAAAHQDALRGKQLVENFMKTHRDPQYQCRPTIQEAIVEEIAFQKRVELWGEGQSFFDVKRLNLPVTRGYEGTNHLESECFNTTTRPAWMSWVIIKTEEDGNAAITGYNNPDPSGVYTLWQGN